MSLLQSLNAVVPWVVPSNGDGSWNLGLLVVVDGVVIIAMVLVVVEVVEVKDGWYKSSSESIALVGM